MIVKASNDPDRMAIVAGILTVLSGSAACLLLLPSRGGYWEAISLQLARGEGLARVQVAAVTLVLAGFCLRMFLSREFVVAGASLTLCLLLSFLAATNPRSDPHSAAFGLLLVAAIYWHWSLFRSHEDLRLLATAIGATVIVLVCPLSFGVVERSLGLVSLAAMNVKAWGDVGRSIRDAGTEQPATTVGNR